MSPPTQQGLAPRAARDPGASLRVQPSWLDTGAWPFSPRWAALPQGAMHYVDEGSGPPVVLVHGTPTWSFEWRHVIAALRPTRRVIAADHLGFGLSERPPAARYAPEDHARRFAAFIDSLALADPVTLVVHDFGGPIALDWALEHPQRVRRLVVVNSWMWRLNDDPLMRRRAALVHGALGAFLYRRLNASLRLIMPSAYADRRRLTTAVHRQYLAPFPDAESRGRVLWALARALLDSSAFYASLWERRERLTDVPTSVLWGVKDSAFGPSMLTRWEEALPHARITRFEEAGHWPHEEEPGAFVEALRDVA